MSEIISSAESAELEHDTRNSRRERVYEAALCDIQDDMRNSADWVERVEEADLRDLAEGIAQAYVREGDFANYAFYLLAADWCDRMARMLAMRAVREADL